MKQNKWILIVVTALVSGVMMASGTAHAKAMFGLAANVNMGLQSSIDIGTISTKPALGFGGGLVVDFPSGNNAFELGAIYTQRSLKTTDSSGLIPSITTTVKSVHIPVTYMLGLGKSFALGLGGFYGLSLESGGGSDYGVAGGLRIKGSGNGGFFFDAKYNMGLKDNAGFKSKEVYGLIGILFGK